MFELNDDDLIVLAPGRKGTLWKALLAAARPEPRFAHAAEILKRWRSPRRLHSAVRVLRRAARTDAWPQALLERLGRGSGGRPSTSSSISPSSTTTAPRPRCKASSLAAREQVVIKRDMEQGRGEVRVMTVHGAKGLEAPIVFLPDTCTTRSGERPGGLLPCRTWSARERTAEPFFWPVKGTGRTAAVCSARQGRRQREEPRSATACFTSH